jgi:hypothetical protein
MPNFAATATIRALSGPPAGSGTTDLSSEHAAGCR